MTIYELQSRVYAHLKQCLKDSTQIVNLLMLKAKFPNYSIQNALSLLVQKPATLAVKSYQDWKLVGYRVNPQAKSVKVWTVHNKPHFLRDGQLVPVGAVTEQERQSIMSGQIIVENQQTALLHALYDITDTNCPEPEYSRFLASAYFRYEDAFLFDVICDCAATNGIQVQQTDLRGMGIKGMYVPSEAAIQIDRYLMPSQKLCVITEQYTNAIVCETTTQPNVVAKFEACALSAMVTAQLGRPLTAQAESALVTHFGAAVAEHGNILLESLNRIGTASRFVTTGINAQIDNAIRQDMKQSQAPARGISENFMRDL